MNSRKTLLPANIEAELAVIGGILIDNRKLNEIAQFLTSEAFYEPRCALAYRKILQIADTGRVIDHVLLGELLDKAKVSEYPKLDVDQFFADIDAATPSAANAGHFAWIVHNKSRTRKFIQICEEYAKMGRDDLESCSDMIGGATADLYSLSEGGSLGEALTAAEMIASAKKRFDSRRQGELIGTMSGYRDLDSLVNGFLPGQFVIIAGRPGSGKSALALNIAQNIIFGLNTPVLFFSMEMDNDDMADRMIAPIAGIDGKGIMRATGLTNEQAARYHNAADQITDRRFKLDSTSDRLAQIVASTRRHRHQENIEIVFIDYLQLIDATVPKRENRQEQVAGFSRRLKILARELKIPIVALAQINRDSDKQDRRPRMADLRESGAIEQDADVVLLLHRHELNNPGEKVGEAECIVAKNRNGATGIVRLEYIKHFTKFESIPDRRSENGYTDSPVY